MKIIIPMAGLGSRFARVGYTDHKPLIRVNGKTLLEYTVSSLGINGEYHLVLRDLGGSYLRDVEDVMKNLGAKYEVHVIEHVTSGATETALRATSALAGYTGELVVTNCDQFLLWDSAKFVEDSRKYDGSVLTYRSTDPKNSFAEISGDRVVKIVEKNAISDDALVGVHYWRDASDFVSSADSLLKNRDIKRETYVSETYNYMISAGKKVGAIPVEPGRYWSTGTPEDLAEFKGYVAEYTTPKPKTYFFDLDGTIFMHAHKYSNLEKIPALCPGVKEALDEIDSRGDKIIIVSARKESAREMTVRALAALSVPYDQLVLDVGQGLRVIVNDKMSSSSPPRCKAVEVMTDRGWRTTDL